MSNELTVTRPDSTQPDIQAPLPVPPPRNPAESTDLQVDVMSTAPLVVKVSGEIDIATGPKLREKLLGAIRRHGARLALDLSSVTFMDCAGISVLLAAHRHARLKGGWVRVPRASRRVRKVLMLTGLHQEFALAGPETAAAA
jgi:anti-sigma B factor antagonist